MSFCAQKLYYLRLTFKISQNQPILHRQSFCNARLNIYFSYAVRPDEFRYKLEISAEKETWMHVVLVYKGPENGQGISVYHDGELRGNCTQRNAFSTEVVPSGALKIGKWHEGTTVYAKLFMDELLIWNQQLSLTEIKAVMQMAQSTADQV